MKKYHIHFCQTIDVLAENDDKAREIGINLWNDNPNAQNIDDIDNIEIKVERIKRSKQLN